MRTHVRWMLLGAVALGGCARNVGQELADGLNDRRDTLAAAVRPVVAAAVDEATRVLDDSGGARIGSAGREAVDSTLGAVEPAVSRLLDSMSHRVAALEDSLAAFLSGEGSAALRSLVRANVAELEMALDRAVARWVNTAGEALRTGVVPELGPVGEAFAGRAAEALALRLASGGVLRSAVVDLASAIVDTAITTIRAGAEGVTPTWVKVGGVLLGLALLSVIGIFVLQFIRAKRSLAVVSAVVQDQGDVQTAERVKRLARERGVEQWYHNFLERNRLLVEQADRGRPKESQ